jgi:hypothetical protein
MNGLGAELWSGLVDQWEQLRRVVAFSGPLTTLPGWMAPGLAIGALLALALSAGIALMSLGTMLTALLVAYLLLDRVFGVSVALVAPR